jgi:hypothetical protein
MLLWIHSTQPITIRLRQNCRSNSISLYGPSNDVIDRPHTWSLNRHWVSFSETTHDARAQPTEVPSTVLELLPTMDPWEMHLLAHLEVDDPTDDTLWNALTTKSCILATDGSAPKGKGSFAWIISDAVGSILAKCHGPTFGAKISSYRSEAYGILSILRYLVRLIHIRQAQFHEWKKLAAVFQ